MVTEQDFFGNMQLVLDTAKTNNVILRLIGSIATRIHSQSARAQVIPRVLTDIDFVGYSSQSQQIMQLFEKLGYSSNEDFNMLHGSERLLFLGKDELRIDVFLDVLSMSHKLDLRGRLELDYPTIPLTDLLMTKLQIVELNEKDVKDMICLLHDHELATDDIPEKINSEYIANLCSKDWGMYKTFTMNLSRVLTNLDKLSQDEAMRSHVTKQCKALLAQIEEIPKTTKWKLRARVGEKKRWYELPED
jgi:predicted nucleotidyltransferase